MPNCTDFHCFTHSVIWHHILNITWQTITLVVLYHTRCCIIFYALHLHPKIVMGHSYLNLLNQLHLPRQVDQVRDKRGTGATHPSCASTPVDVVSNVIWELIVDYMGHLKGNMRQVQRY